MKTKDLTRERIAAIRTEWLNQIADDDTQDLTNTLFENILSTQSFGNYTQRLNLNTYVLVESDDEEALALVEVVMSRLGRETICKILDISHSPTISNLSDNSYIEQSVDILFTVLSELLLINKNSERGHTKIYARTDMAQTTLELIHKHIDKQRFQEAGFEVKSKGRNWLAFERIS